MIGKKMNCWDVKKCGREPGGKKCNELGVCPASTETKAHGINDGINGGRACWAIQETLCGSKVQGTFTQKLSNCMQCEFYSAVRNEEGNKYSSSREIISRLG